jgi:hypothetical protein
LFGKLVSHFVSRDTMMPRHPDEGNLVKGCQRKESFLAFFNQSRDYFQATECLKCSLAVKNSP